MKTIKKLSTLISSFAIAGCTSFNGTIIQKIHEPERSWVKIYSADVYNKKQLIQGRIPIYCEDDEDFIIRVKNKKGNTRKFYLKDKELFNELRKEDNFRYNPNLIKQDKIMRRRLSREQWKKYKNEN